VAAIVAGLGASEIVAWTALIEALPEPVIIVDLEIRVMSANKAALQVLPGLRIGEPLTLALRTPDVLDSIRRVQQSASAETVEWHERVPVDRFFEVAVAPLRRASAANAIALTLRDLTEAHSVERMRVDFVANASHELRTPLASLLGFVETLQGAARDDPIAREKFLAIMRDQTRRMARLVDDLLSLSRIEQNLHLRPDDPVDLAIAVRSIVESLSTLARDMGITLSIDAPVPVMVTGDHDELTRVAENLIENAIKYGSFAEAGGSVEISVISRQGDGVLKVRDYGPGIAPEHLPRLTERFYRVDAGASRAKGGTGLGLALVKHIVARHRGRLAIESTPGEGACFTVKIPLYHDPPQSLT
jgi:two-component system, OmpR family, phosphate regulon sensor histidine kinase PhoR